MTGPLVRPERQGSTVPSARIDQSQTAVGSGS